MTFWKKIPGREKDAICIVFALIVVLAYIFLAYSPLRSELLRAEGLVGRKLDRTERRASVGEPPKMSAASLRDELTRLNASLETAERKLRETGSNFASLDGVDEIKRLRLEVTALADFTGVTLLKFGDLKETEETDSVSVLMEETRNEFRRPVFEIEATAAYTALFSFISRISGLSKTVAITRFDIEAPDFGEPLKNGRGGPPLLEAKLEVAF